MTIEHFNQSDIGPPERQDLWADFHPLYRGSASKKPWVSRCWWLSPWSSELPTTAASARVINFLYAP
jgi:hypothetical protein